MEFEKRFPSLAIHRIQSMQKTKWKERMSQIIPKIVLILLVVLFSNCTGFYANDYYYRKQYNESSILNSKKPAKIAIYFDSKKQNKESLENLNRIKSSFETLKHPLAMVTDSNQFKSYDLVLLEYTIQDSEGILNTLEESQLILTYAYMILTLGIFPGMNHYYQYHTIKVYNPALEKEFQIEFTELIRKNDGWIANYYGRNEGVYLRKYDRYYITSETAKEHDQKLLQMIMLEGVIPR